MHSQDLLFLLSQYQPLTRMQGILLDGILSITLHHYLAKFREATVTHSCKCVLGDLALLMAVRLRMLVSDSR